ncbi:hypothetical protein EUAN_24130 [Andreesenia angusta]|uniref:Uncharacterized protein n=1 Tax=Andreesenia angusta TaxID=39480 RepID=A0A1S1V3K4_9FIRM|nr:hypothetical protein [Andreesenia angusta]OHW61233.1 hypothetical protein EUAN_24130 [Andreesenia angusta]
MKTWLKYLLYIVAIFILVFSRQYFVELSGRTFNELFIIGSMVINVLLGALLGIEGLLSEVKREGSWKVNIPKLVLVVIPSLFIASSWFIFSLESFILDIPISVFTANMGIFQLILGYTFITSFHKVNKQEVIG